MSWTTARARWFPALLGLTLLVACSSEPAEPELPPGVVEGSPSVAVGSGTASPSATSAASPTSAACLNEDSVAEDPARQIGPSSTADVDGDGVEDGVRLAADPNASGGCAAFVVVELGNSSVIAAPVWEVGAEGGLPQPRIHGLIDVDGQPGAEVLVDEAAGASTQFVGVFVHAEGDLVRLTAEGGVAPGAGPVADLFPYGGSVGHVEAVDCTDEGIVVSTATPSGEGGGGGSVAYDVERRFFTFDGAGLEKRKVERQTVPIDDLNRFPEYAASPFGSC